MTHIPFVNSVIPGLSWPTLPGTTGTMMLAILQQMDGSQWWPPELLRQKQMEQLDELIRHAQINVPYYRDVLPKRNPDEPMEAYFGKIPLLDRDTVRDRYEDLQSTTLPAEHGVIQESTTSGSTGIPIILKHSAMYLVFEGCGLLRQHRWHNRNFLGKLAGIHHQRKLKGHLPGGPDQPHWGWPVNLVYPSGPANLIEIYRPARQQVAWLQEKNPDYILSMPSNLQNLAEYCIGNGITIPNLKNVNTIMEVVTEEFREICRQAWDVPVIDSYSCKEVGTIASQCPENTHYHICAENVLVEILDANDQPCKTGDSGRVIVTNLHNFAMPLLRYELSDHAVVGGKCSCGRTLPVLQKIMGRVRNMLKLPNGERRWARMGRPQLMKLAPLLQYQFVQTALDTIEVRLVVKRPLTKNDESRLTEHFHRKLPFPYRMVYRYFDEIPRGEGGKIEDFTCEV